MLNLIWLVSSKLLYYYLVLVKLNYNFSECSVVVEVVQGQAAVTGAKAAQPNIFTTYHIEKDLLNGKVHYTSTNGRYAIAFNERGQWCIQLVKDRYSLY